MGGESGGSPRCAGGQAGGAGRGGGRSGFIIARRTPEKPGTGVVFVTPLRGDREIEAATELGFTATTHMHSVRVAGRNEPGVAGKVTQMVAQAGLNLRGFSGAVIGTQFVLHLAFDRADEAKQAIALLQQAG